MNNNNAAKEDIIYPKHNFYAWDAGGVVDGLLDNNYLMTYDPNAKKVSIHLYFTPKKNNINSRV